MKQDGSWALFQYWNRLRRDRPAPMRTEIEPADIKSLLGDTFILERDMRGEAIFRLAGTRLCAVYGRELKGFAFTSLWREADRTTMARLATSVFQSKTVVTFDFEGFGRDDRSASFEFILLPLDGGLENPRCLGALSAASKPFWLGSDPIRDALLGTVRIIDPDRDPLFPKGPPSGAVPPHLPRAKGDVPLINARRIRHLLVLQGGREP
ncbi:PAS domain-containing protein [Arvimicrobium flavum]|uniref:PAS domain-containing protein n=1 Tax=Arvimicrobium flavum TaxID=3393320 RepID=UPI00237ACD2C|nr:PAS domain-containing protein [Mesorhizobium shangrilense]